MIVHFRSGVTPDVLDFLRAAADEQHRSLANLAGKILSEYVAARRSAEAQPDEAPEAAR